MRKLILALALISSPALAAGTIVMHRDPGCGCCKAWLAKIKVALGRDAQTVDDVDRPALQKRVGLPANLKSCHTAIIDGYAIEGHVPAADIKRLLDTRPAGVKGIAVAGMPIGAPGMEAPGYESDFYNVISFGTGTPKIFARH